MGVSEVVQWILLGMMIAGIASAVVIGIMSMPDDELSIAISGNSTLPEKGLNFVFMQLGLKSTTPSYTFEYIPGGSAGSDKWFILEDFPLPDEIDIIGLIIVIIPLFFLFRWEAEGWYLLAKIILIIAMIPLGFILAKLVYYNLYYLGGQNLGFSIRVLTEARMTQLKIYDSMLGPLTILSGTTLAYIARKIIGSVSGD